MSEPTGEETIAELNTALAEWDWNRASNIARTLDSLATLDESVPDTSVLEAVVDARQRVEAALADAAPVGGYECEKWNPYKPAYVAYTSDNKMVWRCIHKKAEGNGPHEVVMST